MRALLLLWLAVAVPAMAQPARLADTGIDAPGVRAFTPRYPLWSDGTSKRRWISLPPGASIDTSRADAWQFPPGTKAWKEFSLERKLETRLIERLDDGTWRFSTYAWNAEGTEARLAPEQGIAGKYAIPSRSDCLACHEAAPSPILGYSAVQLGQKPVASPGLGYLHANCGHCHNDSGPLAAVELSLLQDPARPHESAARTASSVRARGPELLLRKMRSKNPMTRMPPLGVSVIDEAGIALVEGWIRHHLSPPTEPLP